MNERDIEERKQRDIEYRKQVMIPTEDDPEFPQIRWMGRTYSLNRKKKDRAYSMATCVWCGRNDLYWYQSGRFVRQVERTEDGGVRFHQCEKYDNRTPEDCIRVQKQIEEERYNSYHKKMLSMAINRYGKPMEALFCE